MECIDVAIAVVKKGEKILICQRKEDDSLGGFWEFPGGKRETGETLEACLFRELMEEIAIRVTVIQRLSPIRHDYGLSQVTLHPFLCKHSDGEPMCIECQRLEWVNVGQFPDFKFPPANGPLLQEIAEVMRKP
jgi:mutator protein MutT